MSATKILVCENNALIFKAMKAALKNESYTLHWASDGRQALELLKKEPFDLVLTEILLPFFSGLELIQNLRSKQRMSIPILVLSVINTSTTIDLALQLGANEFMPKPFAPESLKSRIAQMLVNTPSKRNSYVKNDHLYNLYN